MIEVKELNKIYDNGYCAIDNVSFELPNKGIVCITGESGCGKTTLLNCLQGAESFDGYIAIEGISLNEKNALKLRKKYISVIYQDYDLIEDMTVEANLQIATESVGKKLNGGKMNELLESVGLSGDIAKKLCSKLSGGEKQRVAIVRALIQETKIIMADEPTGNLDSENANIVFDIFKKLSKNMLVVVVTHNEELTRKYADYQIELCDGAIIKNECAECQSDNDNILADNKEANSDKRIGTRLSLKSNLNIFKWLHSDVLMAALFSIFAVVLVATSFVMYSCNNVNYNGLVFKNIKSNPQHVVGIESMGETIDVNLVENDGKVFFGYQLQQSIGLRGVGSESTPKPSEVAKLYNLSGLTNVIELNDISKLGLGMKFGRNAENTNEIVVNEYIARCIISTKTYYDGKLPQKEEDVLGIELKNFDSTFTIVGIADIHFDNQLNKFDFERYDYSSKEVSEFDEEKYSKYKKMESYIKALFDAKLVFVSKGYAEKVGIAQINCRGAYVTSEYEKLHDVYDVYNEKKESNIKINSNYTYGVEKVAEFFEDNNLLFSCIGIFMSVLSVGFVVLANFLLIKNKSNDLLKLRALNMDKSKMLLSVGFSVLIMFVIQLAIVLALSAILLSILNASIARTLVFAFKTLFFDWKFIAILIAASIVSLFTLVLIYTAKLYSKPINYRKQKTVE